jgi:hypothetical protein
MTFTDPNTAVDALNAKGIESGIQGTYFGDQVYVHLYGNNNPAAIYPTIDSFMRWVNAVEFETLSNEPTWYDEDEDCED